jgi:hypothetical protein
MTRNAVWPGNVGMLKRNRVRENRRGSASFRTEKLTKAWTFCFGKEFRRNKPIALASAFARDRPWCFSGGRPKFFA